MTDIRLIPISAEDVERLRSLRTFCAETQRDVPIISDLVTRYESGITKAEAEWRLDYYPEDRTGYIATQAHHFERKVRSAFTQEQDR